MTINNPVWVDHIPKALKDRASSPLATSASSKPIAQTSDERHWYNSFQPLEYRGFLISRDLTYQNLWTVTDQVGKQVTGLHGLHNGLEYTKRRIDNHIEAHSSNPPHTQ